MHINLLQNYALVYSIYNHEILGTMVAPYIVQLNTKGEYTYTYQKINHITALDYPKVNLEPIDLEAISDLYHCEPAQLIKQVFKKDIRVNDFFLKRYNAAEHQAVFRNLIELCLVKNLPYITQKPIFAMGLDGIPTWQPLQVFGGFTDILFHFKRTEQGTRYYPTLQYNGKLVQFVRQNAQLICEKPAWLLLKNQIYCIPIEGKKLLPFLQRPYVEIEPKSELIYYQKFVAPLIEQYRIRYDGFKVYTDLEPPQTVLKLSFDEQNNAQIAVVFEYKNHHFLATEPKKTAVRVAQNADGFIFYKTKRNPELEAVKLDFLAELGLDSCDNKLLFLQENIEEIEKNGIFIAQTDEKRYHFGKNNLTLDFTHNNDWLDIKAKVQLGDFEIPFFKLKQHILNKTVEYVLPNGEIAFIPEVWFTQLHELCHFSTKTDPNYEQQVRLPKQYIGLVNELQMTDNELVKKRNFTQFSATELPQNFMATLRHYQKTGLDWLWFLNKNGFGGILADDMGLGKTIQTLALLLKNKEAFGGETQASLLVVPASLIYNWFFEAQKFAPSLKVGLHTGYQRQKDKNIFLDYDLVITSYGTARSDIQLFESQYFSYLIYDEAQTLKNPDSKTTQVLKRLKAQHRLLLTGTPIENSLIDLWSLMSFANPKLLGTKPYFKKNYATPIEKENDGSHATKLRAIIAPFVLRRTKTEVAPELPPRIEQVIFCEMTQAQNEVYEQHKASFRNEILGSEDIKKSQILLLQGLNMLRQIANHPVMVLPEYVEDSGKFVQICETIANLVAEGHKILVFSQFVKHLQLLKTHLEAQAFGFLYLDGNTAINERQNLVEKFNKTPVNLFLISLKAGGVGLNLTAADYVLLLDPWWNPAIEAQAIDRAHRIGQQQTVISYKFITKNTLEEKIQTLQARKRNLSNQIIENETSFLKGLSLSEVADLLA